MKASPPPGKRVGNELARRGCKSQNLSRTSRRRVRVVTSEGGSSSNSVTEYVLLNIPLFAMSSTVISVQMCTNGKKDSVIYIFDC